jgi:two-component system chemotaxis response regulator CheY
MIVDDTRSFLDPVSMALRHRGYDVVCATDGVLAVAALSAGATPDLILLDLSMPDMDGVAVLRHLRADPRWRETPVFLMTALTDQARRGEAERFGVQRTFVKSQFSLAELFREVDLVVGKVARVPAA